MNAYEEAIEEQNKILAGTPQSEDMVEPDREQTGESIEQKQDASSVVESFDKTEVKKPIHRFQKGVSGNPAGRPKGSGSITTALRKFLEDNPERFDELVQDYLSDKKHRELLWRMFDGNPRNQTDITSNGNPIPILSGAIDAVLDTKEE